MGLYHWLVDQQGKALSCWRQSIAEGERLGANLQLSRAYCEVGKRLREPHSKHTELDGISAEQYLSKARARLEEMELAWDLEQLEKEQQR